MSQPPPPYPSYPQQPYPLPYYGGYGWGAPAGDPYAPGKRAGVLMIVLGALVLLGGFCVGAMGAIVPKMSGNPEMAQAIAQIEQQLGGLSAATMFFAAAVVLGLAGVIQIVLGVLVRGCGMGPTVTGIVWTGLAVLYLLLNLVASLVTPGGLGGACVAAFALALLVLQLVWLVQALRAGQRIRSTQQAYAYGYATAGWPAPPGQYPSYPPAPQAPPGYGYGQPPPPPATSPPPPDDPQR